MPADGQPITPAGRNRAIAEAYARGGRPVFPCATGGTRPLTPRGLQGATTDAVRIGSWWRRWPRANVAMPTGPASGFDVLVIHTCAGVPVGAQFAQLLRTGLLAGHETVVATPCGGVHLYFPACLQAPQESWTEVQAGVEFRGTEGFVIAPGSEIRTAVPRASGLYQVVAHRRHGTPLDSVAVREVVRSPWHRSSSAALAPQSVAATQLIQAVTWTATRSEDGPSGTLFWAACRAAESKVPRQAAGALELAGCRAGLGSAAARATVDSAYRMVAGPRH